MFDSLTALSAHEQMIVHIDSLNSLAAQLQNAVEAKVYKKRVTTKRKIALKESNTSGLYKHSRNSTVEKTCYVAGMLKYS